jgi:hypothetical protein
LFRPGFPPRDSLHVERVLRHAPGRAEALSFPSPDRALEQAFVAFVGSSARPRSVAIR